MPSARSCWAKSRSAAGTDVDLHGTGRGFRRRAGGVLDLGRIRTAERVDGFLALDVGAARILASEAGTVAELLAREGDEVEPASR